MGQTRQTPAVMPILAAFSAFPEALEWARAWMERRFGEIVLASPVFDFHHTDYYQTSMGGGLKKILLAARGTMDPAELPQHKLAANQAEEEFGRCGMFPVPRPLNLDPGYLNESKFILASTKDHAHRIYVGEGIYAEITLAYQRQGWQAMPWTYPDYREPACHAFLTACRAEYRRTKVS